MLTYEMSLPGGVEDLGPLRASVLDLDWPSAVGHLER